MSKYKYNLTDQAEDIILRGMEKTADKVVDKMKEVIYTLHGNPANTGNLMDSVDKVKAGAWNWIVYPSADYASFVNNGRGPVVPKNKPYLVYGGKLAGRRSLYSAKYEGSNFVKKTADYFR